MTDDYRVGIQPTKADAAYMEISNQILNGKLAPGSRVDYSALAEMFQFSITPLREALRRLEADHLVQRNAHRGVIVTPLSAREGAELLNVRETLDVLAVRWAARVMTKREIELARSIIGPPDDEKVAVSLLYLRKGNQAEASSGELTMHRAFHRMIHCGSHNQVIIDQLDAINVRVERYAVRARVMRNSDSSLSRRNDDLDVAHGRLLTAIERHDEDQAARLTQLHYATNQDFVKVIFGESPVDSA